MRTPLEAIQAIEKMLEEGYDKCKIWEKVNSDSRLTDAQLDTVISLLEEEDVEYFKDVINYVAIEMWRNSPTRAELYETNDQYKPRSNT